MHHPAAVLDRAEPAHLQVLFGGGGPVVGGVVDHDDEEARRPRVPSVDRSRGSCSRSRSGSRSGGDPATRSASPRSRARDPPAPGRSPRSSRAVCGTARTRRTAPASPSRTGRRSGPPRRTRASPCAAVPSGSSVTAPAIVGAPTVAIAWLTADMSSGSAVTPGSSAPSPHTTRSGGSWVSSRCRSMFRRATATSSSAPTRSWTEATSTWIAATSTERPFGAGRGIAAGHHGERRRADGQGERPRPSATPPPLPGEQEQPGHDDHRERQGPDPADGREGQRGRVDLGHAQLAPSEPAERDHASDPFDDRPQAGEPEGPEQRVVAPPDGGRQGPERRREPRRHDHESRPPELAEQEDPVQECAEVGEAEHEPAQGRPARARATHEPQERDRRDEHDGPEPDGRKRRSSRSAPETAAIRRAAGSRSRLGLRRNPGRASSPCPSAGSGA